MDNYRLYNGMWIYKSAYYTEQELDKKGVKELLHSGGFAVRNTFNFDCQPTNFWYVIKDSFGGIEELPTKTRNQVRRALKLYDYRIIDKDFMLKYGYSIYKRASESYAIKAVPPTEEAFRQRILSSTDEDEFWGAISKETGELVAIAINHIYIYIERERILGCDYRALKAYPEDLKKYVYYGLIFTMNQYYLQEKGVKYVCDGARSATNHSNIQPFLIEKFNFRKAYCNMRIYYKWWLGLIVKILYPFRNIIPIKSVKSLLAMHGMQG